jgi:hypothetical protein
VVSGQDQRADLGQQRRERLERLRELRRQRLRGEVARDQRQIGVQLAEVGDERLLHPLVELVAAAAGVEVQRADDSLRREVPDPGGDEPVDVGGVGDPHGDYLRAPRAPHQP